MSCLICALDTAVNEVLSKTFSLAIVSLITMQIRSTFIRCREPWKHHHIVCCFFFSLLIRINSFNMGNWALSQSLFFRNLAKIKINFINTPPTFSCSCSFSFTHCEIVKVSCQNIRHTNFSKMNFNCIQIWPEVLSLPQYFWQD